MISGIRHVWALFGGLTLGEYFQLAEWHQWLVLGALALLAGMGVHYVLGYVFRFYWRGGKFQWWIALLAMPMLEVSVVMLTGMYVLGIGAPRLADSLLQSSAEGQPALTAGVGQYLLEPALTAAQLTAAQKTAGAQGPTRSQLEQALRAMPGEKLRVALGGESSGEPEKAESKDAAKEAKPAAPQATPPAEPAPANSQAGGAPQPEPPPPPVTSTSVILGIVRDWITEPEQSFPEETAPPATAAPNPAVPAVPAPPAGKPAAKAPPTLATYLIGLIAEVPPDAALKPADWTLIAGTRFSEHMLRPLLLEYFQRTALVLTIVILLLNLGWFWIIQRMARSHKPPAAKPAAAAPKTPPVPDLPKSEPAPGAMAQS